MGQSIPIVNTKTPNKKEEKGKKKPDRFRVRRIRIKVLGRDSTNTLHVYNHMFPYFASLDEEIQMQYKGQKTKSIGTSNLGIDIGGWITLDEIQKICSKRYECEEKRIVVIVLAQYSSSIERIIDDYYAEWNYCSKKGVDFFWLGYRAIQPSDDIQDHKCISKWLDFNLPVYKNEVEKLEKLSKAKIPDDMIGFYFCDYNGHRVEFENGFCIGVEGLNHEEERNKLNRFTNALIKLYKKYSSIKEVMNKAKFTRLRYGIDKNTFMDGITIIGAMEIIIRFLLYLIQ